MLLEILIGIFTLFVAFYVYLTWKWNYWSKRGVYAIKPIFPFGSVPTFFTKKKSANEVFKEFAEETKDLPYFGGYFMRNPILFVNDADIVRQILVKDFDHFVNRSSSNIKDLFDTGHKSDEIWLNQMTNSVGKLLLYKNLICLFIPFQFIYR